nr:hypothetical protein [Pseudomonas sp. SLT2001]
MRTPSPTVAVIAGTGIPSKWLCATESITLIHCVGSGVALNWRKPAKAKTTRLTSNQKRLNRVATTANAAPTAAPKNTLMSSIKTASTPTVKSTVISSSWNCGSCVPLAHVVVREPTRGQQNGRDDDSHENRLSDTFTKRFGLLDVVVTFDPGEGCNHTSQTDCMPVGNCHHPQRNNKPTPKGGSNVSTPKNLQRESDHNTQRHAHLIFLVAHSSHRGVPLLTLPNV